MAQYIVLKHSVFNEIPDEDCWEAGIPKDQIIDYVEVAPIRKNIHESIHNWRDLKNKQRSVYAEEIKPLIAKYPGAIWCYFGLAPISLAIHLGSLIYNLVKLEVYIQNRITKSWHKGEGETSIELEKRYPSIKEEVDTEKHLDFVLSISAQISPNDIRTVSEKPFKTFELANNAPKAGGVQTQADLQNIIGAFGQGMQDIANYYPNVGYINLFAAIPVEVAFYLGTKLNRNMLPPIRLYNHNRQPQPHYKETITIRKGETDGIVLSEEDKQEISGVRGELAESLKGEIKGFIGSLDNAKTWQEHILKNEDGEIPISFQGEFWTDLIPLTKTDLKKDSPTLDMDETQVNNGFRYDKRQKKWKIDDSFFEGLVRRSKKHRIDIQKACRMFLFHESLHFDCHFMSGGVADSIGNFPKVIEDADYQADVWAILYEYAFSKVYHSQKAEEVKDFFCTTIETAIETVWAFNDEGRDLKEIQIRRLNRFLIWYWQLKRIEHTDNDFSKILRILTEKPSLEFAGLPVFSENQRTYYRLGQTGRGELAIFFKNRVHRMSFSQIPMMIEGFRKRESGGILDAMDYLLQQVRIR